MAENLSLNPQKLPVALIVGATTKWRAEGRSTLHAHGHAVDDTLLPPSVRWGAGGAIALKFAEQGFFTVLTTRQADNAQELARVIRDRGGQCMIAELDVASADSISALFDALGRHAGAPEVVIYNVGYFEGRDLPPEMSLLEHVPVEIFDTALALAARGPFLVAKHALPAMRTRGAGSIFFSNNPSCLRGKRRGPGESLYYPRVMQRALTQVLADEYSELGIHVANVIIDGLIDSPGTRALPMATERPEFLMNPAAIADTFYFLHTQDRSCWTHEIQITPHPQKVSV